MILAIILGTMLLKLPRKVISLCLSWITVHEMRSDHQHKDVHAVATSLVFDRVPKKELSSNASQQSLANVNIRDIVTPTVEEMDCTRKRYKILLGNMWILHVNLYEPSNLLKTLYAVPQATIQMRSDHYLSLFHAQLWWKTKNAGDTFANDTSLPVVISGPPIGATSRADQPGSHVPRILPPDDPLPKVPCYGDQLSKARLTGGKDLGAGCHTARDRLDHLYPFRIADCHTKQSLTKVGSHINTDPQKTYADP